MWIDNISILEPLLDKTNFLGFVSSEDSGLLVGLPSRIRVISVHSVNSFLHGNSAESNQIGQLPKLI